MILKQTDTDTVEKAAALLSAGELVAVPTETVYGLAGDATNGDAVASIFATKGRPSFNPLIAHVSGMAMARSIAAFSPLAEKIADAFWPGPLTLVLPLLESANIHPLVTAGLDTVALRHPVGIMSELAGAIGRPLAAPSANTSGKISPTSAGAVEADLGSKVSLIIDNGPTRVGIESTIIAVTGEGFTVLRPGVITAADITKACGAQEVVKRATKISAPGMLLSHYAPDMPVRLDAQAVKEDEALLAFGAALPKGAEQCAFVFQLSESADLREAAANLFEGLRQANLIKPSAIAVAPIPDEGIGLAINDRLRRAAAPRDKTGINDHG